MKLAIALFLTALPFTASAKLVTKMVLYRDGGQVLEGYFAYDDAKGKRPCVLIAHDWDGLGEYEKRRARQLASLGYTGLAIDVYGRGVRPKNVQESAALAAKFDKDRRLTRRRIGAAMRFAMGQPQTDRSRIAAIGYCFGGMVALELARLGAPIRGVVSFHGSLSNPAPGDARFIKAQVLILHGAADPHVPKSQVAAFEKEMKAAKKPYRLVAYPGAVHSFTIKEAGNVKSHGVAYDANADKKSWAEMAAFLKRIFK
jgi:dienelactone hydrolase